MNPRPPPPFFNAQLNEQFNFPNFDPNSLSSYLFNPPVPPYNPFVAAQSQRNTQEPSTNDGVQSTTTQTRKKAQVGSKERNPNWIKEEDEALCKAWLRISEDAVIGTDQPRGKLWERIQDEFNKIMGHETERNTTGLMHRWSTLQSHINKYSGCVRKIERSPTSGFNLEDSIGAAKKLYYQSEGHNFKWDGCWLILKDTAKWSNYTQEQQQRKQKTTEKKKREGNYEDVDFVANPSNPSTPATPSSAAGTVSLEDDDVTPIIDEPCELERPMGTKVTKYGRRRKMIADQVEGLHLFASEFSNMRKENVEIVEREMKFASEREKMKIQAKKEQEERRIEAKLEQERMKIAAKLEQEQLRFKKDQMRLEKDIMMTDINSISTEEGKAWVIAQQKAIIARMKQGEIGDGSSGSM
ncbi:hypothetical protein Vadar_029879 [Vaccinium darrowii]|uniref:Uncharacterized protein n=1 Tax=Vaccinium darrowii TaxID=229202 RepID=A0ACB7Z1G2_9ERIC|nr:hypothetical protein Vadar_029879 [Vaccinium darrowii]